MQYPIIDNLINAYLRNGWTGSNVKNLIQIINPNINGSSTYSNIATIISTNGGFNITVPSTGDSYIGSVPFSNNPMLNSIYARVNENTEYTFMCLDTVFSKNYLVCLDENFIRIQPFISLGANQLYHFTTPSLTKWVAFRLGSSNVFLPNEVYTTKIMLLEGHYDTLLDVSKYDSTDMMYNDFAHRLKLPMIHYFPHPVIDALQRAAAGTQTADDTEVLRHYLTPLGIGGI